MRVSNLFQPVPDGADGSLGSSRELCEIIASGSNWRLERIVSQGHASRRDEWYDQPWDEWVALISGRARIEFETPSRYIDLTAGDAIHLPASCRHRVDWTDPKQPCTWIALHYDATPLADPSGENTTDGR